MCKGKGISLTLTPHFTENKLYIKNLFGSRVKIEKAYTSGQSRQAWGLMWAGNWAHSSYHCNVVK